MPKNLKKVSIIGAGLIGGAVGKAVKERLHGCRVSYYDKSSANAAKAVKLGFADKYAAEIEDCVEDAELIIAAAPVGTFKSIFSKISQFVDEKTVVTDVGSTKVIVSEWAEDILGNGVFIGSHPIAGSEKSGIDNACDVCFEGARCIITPSESVCEEKISFLSDFWEALGMQTSIMTAARHDSIYAVLSHLPHAAAAAMVLSTPEEFIKYAGKGFRDTTRIAEGDSDIWTDIFMTNSENMLNSLDGIIEKLEKLKFFISNNYLSELRDFFEQAREYRKKINK
ncbi:prephenate dehydrogenase [Sedimentisphaera salicampi]|uniref:Arogenate dehydrogenase n=1 Tax=Sedimentisphaera salicampi TaxID=1941349 RepID=A0A1W6LJS8_9BACT|nr:prephenate dehydrogenase/arogenate dehydrogenase family protein [Sedimentisphaera salicampi]ARN56050.1 Arogenate dehydrogenase [Sedimentisphaera salicampi]OXU15783.1 Arogenate dehydrogenase [Sedimentisphaera salicampi]